MPLDLRLGGSSGCWLLGHLGGGLHAFPLPLWNHKDHLRYRSRGEGGAGAGALGSLVPLQRQKCWTFPSGRGSPGLWDHQACLYLAPVPPSPPEILLLQDRKIRALEELLETLQEHEGKRPSRWAAWLSCCTSPGPLTPGHQGSKASS